jgi:hypothetical protein
LPIPVELTSEFVIVELISVEDISEFLLVSKDPFSVDAISELELVVVSELIFVGSNPVVVISELKLVVVSGLILDEPYPVDATPELESVIISELILVDSNPVDAISEIILVDSNPVDAISELVLGLMLLDLFDSNSVDVNSEFELYSVSSFILVEPNPVDAISELVLVILSELKSVKLESIPLFVELSDTISELDKILLELFII